MQFNFSSGLEAISWMFSQRSENQKEGSQHPDKLWFGAHLTISCLLLRAGNISVVKLIMSFLVSQQKCVLLISSDYYHFKRLFSRNHFSYKMSTPTVKLDQTNHVKIRLWGRYGNLKLRFDCTLQCSRVFISIHLTIEFRCSSPKCNVYICKKR